MIDPLERWRGLGLPDKPDYAGLLTFGGAPYTQSAAELDGVDVAIVGAPTDDLVSDRPGTRFGARASGTAGCPPGRHLEVGVDAFADLRIVDFGDAPVLPADAERTHAAIEALVGDVVDAGALPIVLGGDHSISEPNVRAVASRVGPVGLVHFDTHHRHRPRGLLGGAVARDAHVPARRAGSRRPEAVRPDRPPRLLARSGRVRLAGRARDHVALHARRPRSGSTRSSSAPEVVGDGPAFLSVDIDVLDPAFAPGTGTPEPGGMTAGDLLRACREIAAQANLVGADVVEVLPTAIGSADVTALVAERVVREVAAGLALSRRH